jgi:predicted permease
VLDRTTAWQGRAYTITSDGDPERVSGARVTPSFFDVLHMPPAAGRYFSPDEGSAKVVVLSYPFWQVRFGGDRSLIGRDITLNGESHTVIGVTPEKYTLRSFDERLWTPFEFDPALRTNYGAHSYVVMAKLKPGVSRAAAQDDLERVTGGIRERNPEAMKDRGVNVEPVFEALIGGYRTQLRVLLGAVGFVLLIACGNVASLQLARAVTRRKEIAVRGALGGSRSRIVRQLLTESLLLGVCGGLGGLAVANLGIRFLVGMGPEGVPRLQEAGLHASVLGFAMVATLVCALIFGLAPAIRATRGDLQSTLREGGRLSRGTGHDRLRSALVVTEFAFALVLLVAAGLFIRSAQRLQQVSLGFEPAGVTMARFGLPEARYGPADVVQSTFARVIEQVRATPGIEAVAAGTAVPLWGPNIDAGFRIEGSGREPRAAGVIRLVSDDFHRVLGIPLKRGRLLQPSDLAGGAPAVVLVNETLARALFGDADAVGRRLWGWSNPDAPVWREIVGVVGDVRAFGREAGTPPEIYIPYTQAPDGAWGSFGRSMILAVKARPGMAVIAGLRSALGAIDPLVPLQDAQSMTDVVTRSTSNRRFNTLLLTLLGATGLVLAAIGIYGLIAFLVGQRTQEIGVRMVLGATTRSITVMILRHSAVLALLGVVIGALASFWTTRSLRGLLFEVQATDPLTYAGAAVALTLAAILAALIPARRASRVEPARTINAG